MYDDCLSGSWLSERLGIDASRVDRMRRGGELIGVRPQGSTAWLYPAWQFHNGKPYPVVPRIVAAAAEAGLDETRLYEVLTLRMGALGAGQKRLADLLAEGGGNRSWRRFAPAVPCRDAARRPGAEEVVRIAARSRRRRPDNRAGCAHRVVGPNGSGKSTLMKLLAGLEEPDEGEVTRRRGVAVSYLDQHPAGDARTALDTVLSARPDLVELEHELATVAKQLGEPAVAANLDRMTRVLHRQEQLIEHWDAAGGPSVEGRARATLLELGLEEEELELPTRALSGGQRKLIALAACLEQRPDVLLLDEPEAHLDNVGRARVERLASRFDGAIVAVSHDRYLLDEIVTTIASLDAGRIRLWPGNYSAYTVARELELERQRQQYVTQQKEIERLEAAIKRFELWASWVPDERHIRQARNKQRQIDRMDKVERPVLERRRIALQLRPTTRGGQRVFELRSLGVAFGSEPVLAGIDLTVMHGERVGVVGDNGAGKSVLLKMLVGEIEPTEGEVWVGPSIEIGYLAQDQDTLDPASTSPGHSARAPCPFRRRTASAC